MADRIIIEEGISPVVSRDLTVDPRVFNLVPHGSVHVDHYLATTIPNSDALHKAVTLRRAFAQAVHVSDDDELEAQRKQASLAAVYNTLERRKLIKSVVGASGGQSDASVTVSEDKLPTSQISLSYKQRLNAQGAISRILDFEVLVKTPPRQVFVVRKYFHVLCEFSRKMEIQLKKDKVSRAYVSQIQRDMALEGVDRNILRTFFDLKTDQKLEEMRLDALLEKINKKKDQLRVVIDGDAYAAEYKSPGREAFYTELYNVFKPKSVTDQYGKVRIPEVEPEHYKEEFRGPLFGPVDHECVYFYMTHVIPKLNMQASKVGLHVSVVQKGLEDFKSKYSGLLLHGNWFSWFFFSEAKRKRYVAIKKEIKAASARLAQLENVHSRMFEQVLDLESATAIAAAKMTWHEKSVEGICDKDDLESGQRAHEPKFEYPAGEEDKPDHMKKGVLCRTYRTHAVRQKDEFLRASADVVFGNLNAVQFYEYAKAIGDSVRIKREEREKSLRHRFLRWLPGMSGYLDREYKIPGFQRELDTIQQVNPPLLGLLAFASANNITGIKNKIAIALGVATGNDASYFAVVNHLMTQTISSEKLKELFSVLCNVANEFETYDPGFATLTDKNLRKEIVDFCDKTVAHYSGESFMDIRNTRRSTLQLPLKSVFQRIAGFFTRPNASEDDMEMLKTARTRIHGLLFDEAVLPGESLTHSEKLSQKLASAKTLMSSSEKAYKKLASSYTQYGREVVSQGNQTAQGYADVLSGLIQMSEQMGNTSTFRNNFEEKLELFSRYGKYFDSNKFYVSNLAKLDEMILLVKNLVKGFRELNHANGSKLMIMYSILFRNLKSFQEALYLVKEQVKKTPEFEQKVEGAKTKYKETKFAYDSLVSQVGSMRRLKSVSASRALTGSVYQVVVRNSPENGKVFGMPDFDKDEQSELEGEVKAARVRDKLRSDVVTNAIERANAQLKGYQGISTIKPSATGGREIIARDMFSEAIMGKEVILTLATEFSLNLGHGKSFIDILDESASRSSELTQYIQSLQSEDFDYSDFVADGTPVSRTSRPNLSGRSSQRQSAYESIPSLANLRQSGIQAFDPEGKNFSKAYLALTEADRSLFLKKAIKIANFSISHVSSESRKRQWIKAYSRLVEMHQELTSSKNGDVSDDSSTFMTTAVNVNQINRKNLAALGGSNGLLVRLLNTQNLTPAAVEKIIEAASALKEIYENQTGNNTPARLWPEDKKWKNISKTDALQELNAIIQLAKGVAPSKINTRFSLLVDFAALNAKNFEPTAGTDFLKARLGLYHLAGMYTRPDLIQSERSLVRAREYMESMISLPIRFDKPGVAGTQLTFADFAQEQAKAATSHIRKLLSGINTKSGLGERGYQMKSQIVQAVRASSGYELIESMKRFFAGACAKMDLQDSAALLDGLPVVESKVETNTEKEAVDREYFNRLYSWAFMLSTNTEYEGKIKDLFDQVLHGGLEHTLATSLPQSPDKQMIVKEIRSLAEADYRRSQEDDLVEALKILNRFGGKAVTDDAKLEMAQDLINGYRGVSDLPIDQGLNITLIKSILKPTYLVFRKHQAVLSYLNTTSLDEELKKQIANAAIGARKGLIIKTQADLGVWEAGDVRRVGPYINPLQSFDINSSEFLLMVAVFVPEKLPQAVASALKQCLAKSSGSGRSPKAVVAQLFQVLHLAFQGEVFDPTDLPIAEDESGGIEIKMVMRYAKEVATKYPEVQKILNVILADYYGAEGCSEKAVSGVLSANSVDGSYIKSQTAFSGNGELRQTRTDISSFSFHRDIVEMFADTKVKAASRVLYIRDLMRGGAEFSQKDRELALFPRRSLSEIIAFDLSLIRHRQMGQPIHLGELLTYFTHRDNRFTEFEEPISGLTPYEDGRLQIVFRQRLDDLDAGSSVEKIDPVTMVFGIRMANDELAREMVKRKIKFLFNAPYTDSVKVSETRAFIEYLWSEHSQFHHTNDMQQSFILDYKVDSKVLNADVESEVRVVPRDKHFWQEFVSQEWSNNGDQILSAFADSNSLDLYRFNALKQLLETHEAQRKISQNSQRDIDAWFLQELSEFIKITDMSDRLPQDPQGSRLFFNAKYQSDLDALLLEHLGKVSIEVGRVAPQNGWSKLLEKIARYYSSKDGAVIDQIRWAKMTDLLTHKTDSGVQFTDAKLADLTEYVYSNWQVSESENSPKPTHVVSNGKVFKTQKYQEASKALIEEGVDFDQQIERRVLFDRYLSDKQGTELHSGFAQYTHHKKPVDWLSSPGGTQRAVSREKEASQRGRRTALKAVGMRSIPKRSKLGRFYKAIQVVAKCAHGADESVRLLSRRANRLGFALHLSCLGQNTGGVRVSEADLSDEGYLLFLKNLGLNRVNSSDGRAWLKVSPLLVHDSDNTGHRTTYCQDQFEKEEFKSIELMARQAIRTDTWQSASKLTHLEALFTDETLFSNSLTRNGQSLDGAYTEARRLFLDKIRNAISVRGNFIHELTRLVTPELPVEHLPSEKKEEHHAEAVRLGEQPKTRGVQLSTLDDQGIYRREILEFQRSVIAFQAVVRPSIERVQDILDDLDHKKDSDVSIVVGLERKLQQALKNLDSTCHSYGKAVTVDGVSGYEINEMNLVGNDFVTWQRFAFNWIETYQSSLASTDKLISSDLQALYVSSNYFRGAPRQEQIFEFLEGFSRSSADAEKKMQDFGAKCKEYIEACTAGSKVQFTAVREYKALLREMKLAQYAMQCDAYFIAAKLVGNQVVNSRDELFRVIQDALGNMTLSVQERGLLDQVWLIANHDTPKTVEQILSRDNFRKVFDGQCLEYVTTLHTSSIEDMLGHLEAEAQNFYKLRLGAQVRLMDGVLSFDQSESRIDIVSIYVDGKIFGDIPELVYLNNLRNPAVMNEINKAFSRVKEWTDLIDQESIHTSLDALPGYSDEQFLKDVSLLQYGLDRRRKAGLISIFSQKMRSRGDANPIANNLFERLKAILCAEPYFETPHDEVSFAPEDLSIKLPAIDGQVSEGSARVNDDFSELVDAYSEFSRSRKIISGFLKNSNGPINRDGYTVENVSAAIHVAIEMSTSVRFGGRYAIIKEELQQLLSSKVLLNSSFSNFPIQAIFRKIFRGQVVSNMEAQLTNQANCFASWMSLADQLQSKQLSSLTTPTILDETDDGHDQMLLLVARAQAEYERFLRQNPSTTSTMFDGDFVEPKERVSPKYHELLKRVNSASNLFRKQFSGLKSLRNGSSEDVSGSYNTRRFEGLMVEYDKLRFNRASSRPIEDILADANRGNTVFGLKMIRDLIDISFRELYRAYHLIGQGADIIQSRSKALRQFEQNEKLVMRFGTESQKQQLCAFELSLQFSNSRGLVGFVQRRKRLPTEIKQSSYFAKDRAALMVVGTHTQEHSASIHSKVDEYIDLALAQPLDKDGLQNFNKELDVASRAFRVLVARSSLTLSDDNEDTRAVNLLEEKLNGIRDGLFNNQLKAAILADKAGVSGAGSNVRGLLIRSFYKIRLLNTFFSHTEMTQCAEDVIKKALRDGMNPTQVTENSAQLDTEFSKVIELFSQSLPIFSGQTQKAKPAGYLEGYTHTVEDVMSKYSERQDDATGGQLARSASSSRSNQSAAPSGTFRRDSTVLFDLKARGTSVATESTIHKLEKSPNAQFTKVKTLSDGRCFVNWLALALLDANTFHHTLSEDGEPDGLVEFPSTFYKQLGVDNRSDFVQKAYSLIKADAGLTEGYEKWMTQQLLLVAKERLIRSPRLISRFLPQELILLMNAYTKYKALRDSGLDNLTVDHFSDFADKQLMSHSHISSYFQTLYELDIDEAFNVEASLSQWWTETDTETGIVNREVYYQNTLDSASDLPYIQWLPETIATALLMGEEANCSDRLPITLELQREQKMTDTMGLGTGFVPYSEENFAEITKLQIYGVIEPLDKDDLCQGFRFVSTIRSKNELEASLAGIDKHTSLSEKIDLYVRALSVAKPTKVAQSGVSKFFNADVNTILQRVGVTDPDIRSQALRVLKRRQIVAYDHREKVYKFRKLDEETDVQSLRNITSKLGPVDSFVESNLVAQPLMSGQPPSAGAGAGVGSSGLVAHSLAHSAFNHRHIKLRGRLAHGHWEYCRAAGIPSPQEIYMSRMTAGTSRRITRVFSSRDLMGSRHESVNGYTS